MLEAILFIAGSSFFLYISWPILRSPGLHGFYRFFAWETLLVLFLLNFRQWFDRPYSLPQLFSWIFLLASLYLVIQGVVLLRRRGHPDPERMDAHLIGIEKTTVLVTDGIFARIRHPLYSSLMFLGWGIFFKQPTWRGGLLALVASVFIWATARAEEWENLQYFGEAYREYMRRTGMFLPSLRGRD